MIPILVKGDDIKSRTKAYAHPGQLWVAQASDNGLSKKTNCNFIFYTHEILFLLKHLMRSSSCLQCDRDEAGKMEYQGMDVPRKQMF